MVKIWSDSAHLFGYQCDLKFYAILPNFEKRHIKTSITSKPSVWLSSKLVCDILDTILTKWYDQSFQFRNSKIYVNWWRHFDVFSLTLWQIGWHTSERPFDKEHNGVGFMSLALLEQKLWPKMWFLYFRWPWPWPWPFKI